MGYHVRQTLIVTGMGVQFENAYKKAKHLFNSELDGIKLNLVSEISNSFNQYKNFCVFDSGSKCCWELDNEYKRRVLEMIEFLKNDKDSLNDWVLVEYGDTGRRIKASNCRNKF